MGGWSTLPLDNNFHQTVAPDSGLTFKPGFICLADGELMIYLRDTEINILWK